MYEGAFKLPKEKLRMELGWGGGCHLHPAQQETLLGCSYKAQLNKEWKTSLTSPDPQLLNLWWKGGIIFPHHNG